MVALNHPVQGNTDWYTPVDSNWSSIESLLTRLLTRRIRFVQILDGSTNMLDAFGMSAPTVRSNGGASVVNDSTGQYVNLLGNSAGLAGLTINSYNNTQTQQKPIFYTPIKTGPAAADLVNCRIWVGLFSADPSTSDTPAVHLAAFRYAPASDGTAFWRTVTDNGSGSPTVIVTSVAIAVDTRYELRVDASDPTSIAFYINDTLVATHTTTLPTTTQSLGPVEVLKGTDSTNRSLRVSNYYLSSY